MELSSKNVKKYKEPEQMTAITKVMQLRLLEWLLFYVGFRFAFIFVINLLWLVYVESTIYAFDSSVLAEVASLRGGGYYLS